MGDENIYWNQAHKIASGAEWSLHPFWPPLPYYFLAGVEVAGGGMLAVQVIQTVMLLGIALLVGDLSRHLSGSPLAAVVAGWLVLVYPPLVAFTGYLWPEVPHLLLFLAAFWILVRRTGRPAWLAGAGLLLGLAILTKYLLWPFLPVLLLPLAGAGTRRERAARLALVALGLGLTLGTAAFLTRQPQLGVRIVSSPIFNLWVGLNDRSRKNFVDQVVGPEFEIYQESGASFSQRNEILLDKIRRRVREQGVWRLAADQLSRQYFRLFDKDSFFTEQLPGGEFAAAGRGYRAPPPLLAAGLRWTSYGLYSAVLVGAVVGMAVCPHAGRRWLRVGAAFLGYNLIIFFALHVKSRYRIQLLPFLFLYAGCAIAWGAERLRLARSQAGVWKEKIAASSWLLAGLGAALLLFLAWGGPLLAGP